MRFHEPLLTAADEVALAGDIEAGVVAGAVLAGLPGAPRTDATAAELRRLVATGEAARQRFLLANCRLVMEVAHAAARRSGLSADDLFQEGFLGLARALELFDARRGNRFATPALPWVRKYVADAVVTRCGEANLPPWAVRRAGFDGLPRVVALEAGDRELPLPDPHALAPFRAVDEPATDVLGLLDGLPALERQLMVLRHVEGLSQREAALRLGLGATTVRRVEARALARLRAAVRREEAA